MFVIRRLAILRGGHVAQNALLPLINTVALRGRGQLTWLLTDELTGREERKADRPILPGATNVHGSSPPIENSEARLRCCCSAGYIIPQHPSCTDQAYSEQDKKNDGWHGLFSSIAGGLIPGERSGTLSRFRSRSSSLGRRSGSDKKDARKIPGRTSHESAAEPHVRVNELFLMQVRIEPTGRLLH